MEARARAEEQDRRAREDARAAGFTRSSRVEVGRLLRVLAASRPAGSLAEVGTGYGVGSVWLRAGLRPGSRLVTVEIDAAAHASAARRLVPLGGVQCLLGDWHEALVPYAPFELVFFDGGAWKADPAPELARVRALLRPGGILVADDMTPDRTGPDPVRAALLDTPAWIACEVRTTAATSAIVAARAIDA